MLSQRVRLSRNARPLPVPLHVLCGHVAGLHRYAEFISVAGTFLYATQLEGAALQRVPCLGHSTPLHSTPGFWGRAIKQVSESRERLVRTCVYVSRLF